MLYYFSWRFVTMADVTRIFIFSENIFCIYRNYTSFGKLLRLFIIIRMAFEISLSIMFLIQYLNYYTMEPITSNIYFVIAHISAVFHIFIPWSKSSLFQHMLHLLNTNVENFKFKSIYDGHIKRQKKKIIFAFGLFCTSKLYEMIHNIVTSFFEVPRISRFYTCALEVYIITVETRFAIEFFILSWLLIVFANQLQHITYSIELDSGLVDNESITLLLEYPSSEEICSQIDKFSVIYVNLSESFKSLNCIFGIQVSILETSFLIIIIFCFDQ